MEKGLLKIEKGKKKFTVLFDFIELGVIQDGGL